MSPQNPLFFSLFFFFFFLLLFFTVSTSSLDQDRLILLSFKSNIHDPSNSLSSWTYDSPTTTPCSWLGVTCNPSTRRVTKLVLEDLDLTGPIDALTNLTQLRVLSLKNNGLTNGGGNLNFSLWHNIKHVYLSHNRFSGNFPAGVSGLRHLQRLDLSYNGFSGLIPLARISGLGRLLTLRLEVNSFSGFSGSVGDGPISIVDFNVSGNSLSGDIPTSLAGFPVTSFAGNENLCGKPLLFKCSNQTVKSEPAQSKQAPLPKKRLGNWVVVMIVGVDVVAVVAAVATVMYCCYYRRKRNRDAHEQMMTKKQGFYSQKRGFYGGGGEGEEMMVFEGCKGFGALATTQSKPSSESVQNSTSLSSQVKGKKRERVDQGSDSSKRERLSKSEDGESGQNRAEQVLRSEIAKITEKGGLLNFEGVEKLVQLMQSDGVDKKINLASRIMLVDVIAITDSFDCLGGFLELRGLPVLDEWLQDLRKGKIGDCGSPKDGEKSVEDFLLAVLRALDKLPVNLQALQTCNVGKSVNHLRTHRNSEIQKKARSLVDTWKKRVEAELKIDDVKYESSRGVSWSAKPAPSEVSHVGNRKAGLSADDGVKSSTAQSSGSKGSQAKLGVGDSMSKSSPTPGSIKSVITSAGGNLKDPNFGMLGGAAGSSDPLLTPIKEERSSSSSQSQNNSQSCSSDHAKTASSCREDARSSTAGSVSKSSSGSRQRRSTNGGVHRSTLSGGHKDSGLGNTSSLNRNVISKKTSPTVVQHDKLTDVSVVDHGNNQRLIVRLPNTGRSPSRAVDAGSIEDSAILRHKASPSAGSHDNHDRRVRMKTEHRPSNDVSSTNPDCHGKDGLGGSDRGIVSTACDEKGNPIEGGEKIMELAKATRSLLGPVPWLGKSYEGSLSSINALVESCVKFSEANNSPCAEDDVGMNLLASVAAGEILKSESVSPSTLPDRNSPAADELCSGNEEKLRHTRVEGSQVQCQPDDGAEANATAEQCVSGDQLKAKHELRHTSTLVSISTVDDKGTSFDIDKEKRGTCVILDSPNVQLTSEDTGLRSTGKPDDLKADSSVAQSPSHVKSEGEIEGGDQSHECRKIDVQTDGKRGLSDSKSKSKTLMFDDDNKVEHVDGSTGKSSAVVPSEPAAESTKVEKEANEKLCHSTLELGEQKQNSMDRRVDSNILAGQNASPLPMVCDDHLDNKSESVSPPMATENMSYEETKAEALDDSKEGAAAEGLSVSHVESQVDQGPENKLCQNSSVLNFGVVESERELQPSDGHSAGSAAGSGMAIKLDFDLNEGIPSDDGNQGEPVKLSIPGIAPSVHLSCPLPNPISSMSGSFSTSITVAAAAKGSFLPLENLLRTKGELGWTGTAATSAFRPAEPKRNWDIHASAVIPGEMPTVSKQSRPPLDFDLNETSVEDVASQGCTQASCSESVPRDCGKGGLGLDLNKIDEVFDNGVFSAFNHSTSETPELPSMSSLPVALPNGLNIASRGFDLNNGPGIDEVGSGAALHSNPVKSNLQFPSPIPGVRVNGPEFGNFSCFPPANSYSAITVPSILSGRGEQYVAATAGSQRILAPNYCTPFGSEMFRGPVLSSSPAVPFSSTGSFQYPGFPFETNSPLSANSFSGASTAYVDSSTGGPLRFPSIPSQLVGSTGLVSSPYHRPYMMRIPGGTNNVASNNRKWGGQLDLNAGPG